VDTISGKKIMKNRKKWEYLQVVGSRDGVCFDSNLDNVGQDGWELVSVLRRGPDNRGEYHHVAYLKR
jgi:hypothetical protein